MNRRNTTNGVESSDKVTSVRPKRIAVGLRPKLSLEGKDPNYEYRFVNDTPGRIALFKQGGWELTTNDEVDTGTYRAEEASEVGSLAYTIVDQGTGLKAYVMKIKKEWYQEFLDEHEAENQRTEESLRPNYNDGGYGSVKIDRSGRR